MKTRVISILGLALLGVAAFGCSAEQGSGEPSTDRTESPLVVKEINDSGTSAPRMDAASCVIRDTDGIDKMLLFGGQSAAGTISNKTFLYDPALDTWTVKQSQYTPVGGGALTNMPSLKDAKLIAVPGQDQCLLVGGDNGTSPVTSVFLYDLSANTWTAKATMPTARRDFELAVCGTNTGANTIVLAIAGFDGTNYLTAIDKFELGNGANGTWTGAWKSLNESRASFALANNDPGTYKQYIVAGGKFATNMRSTVETINITANDCSTASTPSVAKDSGGTTLSIDTRSKLVAFPSGNTDAFIVTAGENNAGTVQSTSYEVTIQDWTDARPSTRANATALTTARTNPKVVPYVVASGAVTRWAVVGGLDSGGLSEDAVQVWNTVSLGWNVERSLSAKRVRFVTEYLTSEGRDFAAGGFDTNPNPDVVIDGVESY